VTQINEFGSGPSLNILPPAYILTPVDVLNIYFPSERFAVLVNGYNDGIYELSDAVTE
jgi:hypothetical protein